MTQVIENEKSPLEEKLDALEKVVEGAEAWMENADFDQMELAEIAKVYWSVKGHRDRAKELATRLYHIQNAFDKGIIPAQFEKREVDMIRVPEMARSFSLRTNTSASMTDREGGMAWLRKNGHEDLIQNTVNAGTLASFARNLLLEEGVELPEEYFKVSTYNSTGSAKYTPK